MGNAEGCSRSIGKCDGVTSIGRRKLVAATRTRDNWTHATIGRVRQLDACDNWTVDACDMH
jgi:hypothetical protein